MIHLQNILKFFTKAIDRTTDRSQQHRGQPQHRSVRPTTGEEPDLIAEAQAAKETAENLKALIGQ